MRTKRFIPCALLLPITALAACQPSGTNAKFVGTGMDMFTPVKMRLHPLSRVVTSGPSPMVEAHVEFTDQFGDIGKGVGDVHFDLFAYETLAFGNRGERLGQWQIDLSTPAENREHWDAITRTYLFKLPLQSGSLADHSRVVLSATIALPGGQQVTDQITLPVK